MPKGNSRDCKIVCARFNSFLNIKELIQLSAMHLGVRILKETKKNAEKLNFVKFKHLIWCYKEWADCIKIISVILNRLFLFDTV